MSILGLQNRCEQNLRVSANEKIVGVIYVVARHIPKAFTLEQVEVHGGHIGNRSESWRESLKK